MGQDGTPMGQVPEDRGLVSQIGPLKIDWPRSLGYFGGIGLAVATGVIEPPLGLFIAAVPFLKMLNQPKASRPTRFVAQVLEGAAQPVGGNAEATIELRSSHEAPAAQTPRGGIWQEARQIADRARGAANPGP